ncbi:hypothetical protein BDV06DRAFT_198708 [Aspergillus oleicola]
MLVFQSKFNRLETQLGGLHQRINDAIDSNYRDWPNERIDIPIEPLATLANIVDQLSIDPNNDGIRHTDRLVDVVTKSRGHVHPTAEHLASETLNRHLNDLSWLISAKASTQTIFAVLKVLSGNFLSLEEELHYWEDVLGFDWSVGLYTLQTSPFRAWRRWVEPSHDRNSATTSRRAADDLTDTGSLPNIWRRFYASVQRCMSPVFRRSKFWTLSSLSRSRFDIRNKRRKLKAMRDLNANAVGVLLEEFLSFDVDRHVAASGSEVISNDLRQMARANVSLLKVVLDNAETDNGSPIHAKRHHRIGDNASSVTKSTAVVDPLEPQDILQELTYVLTDLLPKYQHASAEVIRESGRPSPTIRYWLPLSLALVSATTSIEIAKNVGPALVKSISNFGTTALDFWRNWVVEPTWKLVRTIRHDETSDIALMSKNSLEADRASLERMVVDFVFDRGEQIQPTSFSDTIVDKVREGDLTPVLRAYEKDLRSPFMGTVRGDLVRALLIQIQKTKVDVEIAMSGIDALLRSQELVFGFVGLTPGLLISYASIRWAFGLLGNRRGFRMGRRQDDLRYALRKIHRVVSTSSSTDMGRLSYRSHGLLVCNVEVLLMKARTILKDEDFRAFREDSSDLINENRIDKQLQIVERIAWTYSKWM